MMLEVNQYWWAYLILGLVAGTFGAALGVGGGVIMVPALVWFFGAGQKPAQACSMGAMIGIATMGFYRYWAEPEIRKNIEILPVILMGLTAMAGAYIGVKIAAALPKAMLQKIFAVVLVVAAVRLFLKSMEKPAAAPQPDLSAPAAPAEPAAEPKDEAG